MPLVFPTTIVLSIEILFFHILTNIQTAFKSLTSTINWTSSCSLLCNITTLEPKEKRVKFNNWSYKFSMD